MTECYIGWSKEYNSQGRCCCNCEYQVEIMRHPWNQMVGGRMKGPVTVNAGWGCSALDDDLHEKKIVFFEEEHSMCEMHNWKQNVSR